VSPNHLGIGVAQHPRYSSAAGLAKPAHGNGVPKLLYVRWFLSTVQINMLPWLPKWHTPRDETNGSVPRQN
jgi:hypothetical protein